MKKWEKPVINRIKLDPKQAVMQTCAQNIGFGAWINEGGDYCRYGTAVGTAPITQFCDTSPRGLFAAGATTSVLSNQDAGS